MIALYGPVIVKAPWLWGYAFKAVDNNAGVSLCLALFGPIVRRRIADAIEQTGADAVVSVHPVVNHAMAQARRRLGLAGLPLVTVLTDLVDVHRFWVSREVDQYVAGSDAAAARLDALGVAPHKIATLGIPLRPAFSQCRRSAREMRRELGVDPDRSTILVMGGGEGAGRIVETAQRIAGLAHRRRPDFQVLVVAGRNEVARRALERHLWPVPARVYGFAPNIAELMTAADVVVTKPGSLTVSEALTLGRPLVLGPPLPGQEEGNVPYVVHSGAGFAYRDPDEAAEAVEYLLDDPATRWEMGQRAARLGHPNATERVLDLVQSLVLRVDAARP
jgi:UDP-N-acetylglucosamine:LPS N-acetylglucosamine transferase